METQLKKLADDLKQINNLVAFDQVKAKYLGKNSVLKQNYQKLKDLPEKERPSFAEDLNRIKQKMEALLLETKKRIEEDVVRQKSFQAIDLTLPPFPIEVGSSHPLTLVEQKCTACLQRLGFEKAQGPEVETPFYNFDALCIPKHHPARDAQDTFWLDNGYLMRSHTTTVQARVLQKNSEKDLPIRIVSPGRVYRNEAVDASHLACFHQYEGLSVGYGIKLTHLKWTLIFLLKELFGAERKVRFKPKYYPYTEPSLGADISCECNKGCDKCRDSGWITVVGAGMVHPDLLKNLGYSSRVTGFAFGFGLSRLVTQFYPVDLRPLYGVNIPFLRALLGK